MALVRSVAERRARLMGMKWEDVPEKHRRGNLLQHSPNHCCSALSDRLPCCCPFNRYIPPSRMNRQMHVVGQGKTGAAATPMAEVSTDPDRLHLRFNCRLQQPPQCPCPARRSIINVVHRASVRVRIENVLESESSERAYKLRRRHELLPLRGAYSIVRFDLSPTITPPLLFLTCRNTSYPRRIAISQRRRGQASTS